MRVIELLKMGEIEISIDQIFDIWNNGKYNKIFDYCDFVDAFRKRGYKII